MADRTSWVPNAWRRFELFSGAHNSGRFLEVGVRTDTDGEPVAFLAMPARPKFLR